MPGPEKLVDGALEIVRPTERRPVQGVELAAQLLVKVVRDEMTEPVGPRSDGEDDDLVRGRGQDETLVVVRMFPDEVDPAGGDDEERGPSKMRPVLIADESCELGHDVSSTWASLTK